MKEKILEYFGGTNPEPYIKDKLTFEEFVREAFEEDLSLRDIYDLYEDYYNLVKFVWDLVHEE